MPAWTPKLISKPFELVFLPVLVVSVLPDTPNMLPVAYVEPSPVGSGPLSKLLPHCKFTPASPVTTWKGASKPIFDCVSTEWLFVTT